MPEQKDILPDKNLVGLVVCGGRSSRMGTDKSMIRYHDMPQRNYLYNMLQLFCEKVLICCNASQTGEIPGSYTVMTDDECYHNIGPMAALLTAFKNYPGKNFLTIGCDYPFFRSADIRNFLSAIPINKPAAFYNEPAKLYEPLLAVYDAASYPHIVEMHARNEFSLQKFLKNINAEKFLPENINCIKSIDTKVDSEHAKKLINSSFMNFL